MELMPATKIYWHPQPYWFNYILSANNPEFHFSFSRSVFKGQQTNDDEEGWDTDQKSKNLDQI